MRLFLVLCLSLFAVPALAAATPWQDIAPGVRARLISPDILEGNKALAGIELDMPQTTKTYWRVPGETGIPAELDLGLSEGIASSQVLWPYPVRDQSQGFTDYVYFGPTVLPLELTLSGPTATLDAAITLGICSDICVPARMHFSLPLHFEKPDRGQGLRLQQALALVPQPWTGSAPVVGLDQTARVLTISGIDPAIDPTSIIATLGDTPTLFGAPQKSPDGLLLQLPVLGEQALSGASVQLTFMTAMGPFFSLHTIAR